MASMDVSLVASHQTLVSLPGMPIMAKVVLASSILLLFMTVIFLSLTTVRPHPLSQQEKLTSLHFFLHDIVSGSSQTAVTVAQPANSSSNSTFFGNMAVMDDPLTVGTDLSSERLGQAQGTYVMASQTEVAQLLVMNLVFTEGGYKGSSLSVVGQNAVMNPERELAVVGGTGVFRFARGYASVRTRNLSSDYALLEYDVQVFHY